MDAMMKILDKLIVCSREDKIVWRSPSGNRYETYFEGVYLFYQSDWPGCGEFRINESEVLIVGRSLRKLLRKLKREIKKNHMRNIMRERIAEAEEQKKTYEEGIKILANK